MAEKTKPKTSKTTPKTSKPKAKAPRSKQEASKPTSSMEKLKKQIDANVDSELLLDLLQNKDINSFIKVVNTLRSGSYKEEGKFLQWVMRIAHNLIIDHFRKEKRIPVMENNFDLKYKSGKYILNNLILLVNKGIGTNILPFRINCKPEVILITLENE